jgi:DNA-binding NtrC family response regulator
LENHDDNMPGPSSSNLNGLRVLLVEDSWQVASAMKRLLELHGADVSGPVATTADAARSISGRAIDVALVDVHLREGETANDLIDQLHDLGIRTVVVTGSADVPSIQGKVAVVLTKPVRADALLQSLRPAGQGKEIQ